MPARPQSPAGRYSASLGGPLRLVVGGLSLACLIFWISGRCGLGPPLLALGLFAGVVLVGNFWLGSGVFAQVLLAGPPEQPRIALTFDDGPDPHTTPQVLAELARHGVRATFFVIGARAQAHPDLLRAMAAAGHQIENHSLHHAWTTAFLRQARIERELAQTQQLIARATGRVPSWFRPPIGILSPPIAAAAQTLGLRLCGWSGKSRDGWATTEHGAALRRLQRALRPGAILLLHDASERGSRPTLAPALLRELLPQLSAHGLHAVTLDELVQPAHD